VPRIRWARLSRSLLRTELRDLRIHPRSCASGPWQVEVGAEGRQESLCASTGRAGRGSDGVRGLNDEHRPVVIVERHAERQDVVRVLAKIAVPVPGRSWTCVLTATAQFVLWRTVRETAPICGRLHNNRAVDYLPRPLMRNKGGLGLTAAPHPPICPCTASGSRARTTTGPPPGLRPSAGDGAARHWHWMRRREGAAAGGCHVHE